MSASDGFRFGDIDSVRARASRTACIDERKGEEKIDYDDALYYADSTICSMTHQLDARFELQSAAHKRAKQQGDFVSLLLSAAEMPRMSWTRRRLSPCVRTSRPTRPSSKRAL